MKNSADEIEVWFGRGVTKPALLESTVSLPQVTFGGKSTYTSVTEIAAT